MKNVKLILKSLFNNNITIDGARKKPWYYAVIIFVCSLLLCVVPVGVSELKNHLDKSFDNTTFYTREAVTKYAEHIKDSGIIVNHNDELKLHLLEGNKEKLDYDIPREEGKTSPFKFRYVTGEEQLNDLKNSDELSNTSYFVFTEDAVLIKIVDPNNPGKPVLNEIYCKNAYKKVGEQDIANSFEEVLNQDGTRNFTKTTEKTWENWKGLIRKFYRTTRLTAAGSMVLVLDAVNVVITLILGFMIWILTRGKQNAYRLFTIWESFKIAFWAALSPALLTLALGFLFTNLARTLFPLLLGIRVMWLSMKSLRPDGSGYAAE